MDGKVECPPNAGGNNISSESLSPSSKDRVSFEASLKELEKIVSELEKGELPLEEQLKSFEKGVAFSRECLMRLDEIERRVEKLIQSADGKLDSTPFQFQEPTA